MPSKTLVDDMLLTKTFKNKAAISFTIASLLSIASFAQTGPGGVSSGSAAVKLWLDGKRVNSDGTNPTVGATVSTWYDQSGNSVNVTQSSSGIATYSASGVTFNNTGYLGGSDATFPTGSANRTVIVCASSPSTAADDVLFFYGTANNNQSYGILKISSATSGFGDGVRSFLYGNDQDMAGGFTPSGTMNIITSTYTNNTQITYINNNAGTSRTPTSVASTTLGAQGLQIGGWNSFTLYSQATIGEVIFYNKVLNDAERIIVNNYLAAKFGLTLSANDLYTADNTANGDFDYNVAGIGQSATGVNTTDGKGSIVEINNASGLDNGEYYIWGHDNGTLGSSATGVPSGIQAKLVRTWRASMVGTITSFDVSFDLTGLGAVTTADLALLIDTNNNGSFADETVAGGGIVSGATSVGSNVYKFSGVTAMTDLRRFTLGTKNKTNTPLPIELVNFEAQPMGASVHLQWTTLSELNNQFFTLERSKEGSLFEVVATIPGMGTTQVKSQYKYADNDPFKGKSYYRLSQTDFDGNRKYFDVVTVKLADLETSLSIHPNPSTGLFSVTLNDGNETTSTFAYLSILDAAGNLLYSARYSLEQKLNSAIQVSPSPALEPGLYIVKVSLGNRDFIQKLVIR